MEIQMIDEEEVWKCPKHPSKRRRSGICAKCLRDRLGDLCPNCANVRPCNTCPVTITASSSASSFLLRFSSTRESAGDIVAARDSVASGNKVATEVDGTEIAADRVSPSIQRSRSVAVSFLRSKFAERESRPPIADRDGEPSIQRSKSVAFSFLRSRFVDREGKPPISGGRRKSVVWSILKTMRSKRVERVGDNGVDEDAKKTSVRIRSYFPSPIRAFRHHTVVQDREVPQCRG